MRPFTFIADALDAEDAQTLTERARHAESIGVTTFAVPDHLVPMPAPIPYLSTVAAVTERLRLTAFVHNNDLRHPAVLAKDLATLDRYSGGRLDVAIGAGWNKPEYDAIGLPFDPVSTRVARLAEAVTVLKGCFRDGPFSFDGEHYTITDSPGLPKPMAPDGPPIIVGGHGKRRTPRLAAQYAAEFNVGFSAADVVGAQFERAHEACDAIGRDPGTLVYSAALTVCCGRDDAEVARRAAAIGRDLDELRATG
ncbi:MAG TPA: LLM class flavin-dependent oxidoreductase, partial [Candidatus Limnocylindrales bacterium]|nr:LLM class flavin-dependent oxidoreductase [Candidatus Limnocylindrales bacterium]